MKKRYVSNPSKIVLEETYTLMTIGKNNWIKGLGYDALYTRVVDGRITDEFYSKTIGKIRTHYFMTGEQIRELNKVKSI